MIFQPAALALLLAASLNALLLLGSGVFALHLLRHWNPASGSERQIALERRTYLVGTLVGLSLLLGLPALALFAHNADAMAPFFTGAMCAVGSLKANAWGMPALLTMLAGFFLAAAWLVLNHLDSLGWDTPLIRGKYRLLVLLAPLALAQAVLLWLYYLNLNPEVITSCCGSLFGPASGGVAAEMAALPVATAMPLFFAGLLLTLAVGLVFLARGRFGRLFGLLAGLHFPLALAAVVAFVAPYIYEQPNHHCPFCLLQAEHGYAGWVLYLPLFLGTASGIGAGLAAAVRAESLKVSAPRVAAGLAKLSLLALGVFGLAVLFYLRRSNLVM
ncbi:MAG: hypothetical protein Q8M09_07665 [Pseudomonadota bacterium]|nr:hypothetical protein [Pseudomonadota bacterium]MDP1904105.1 hypothetical protein [Pseudomonadota bacterium]MDP2354220.1 hypothetical protein [Pseudomonadota bacterium]